MFNVNMHYPRHPIHDVPEEFAPDMAPVEPDEGTVPAHLSDDPEHHRVVDPGANLVLQSRSNRNPLELISCP